MDLDLSGKVALVTGGSKGIGKSIAKRLARSGANVAICARGKSDLEKTSREIASETEAGVPCRPSGSRIARRLSTVRNRGGRPLRPGRHPCLLRQRAVGKGGTFSTIADDEWVSHMNLKFFSAVRCAREVLPYMQTKKMGPGDHHQRHGDASGPDARDGQWADMRRAS